MTADVTADLARSSDEAGLRRAHHAAPPGAARALLPDAGLVATRANRQPALAVYARDQASGAWRASGLLLISIRGGEIAGITRFESGTLRPFGLPGILPG